MKRRQRMNGTKYCDIKKAVARRRSQPQRAAQGYGFIQKNNAAKGYAGEAKPLPKGKGHAYGNASNGAR